MGLSCIRNNSDRAYGLYGMRDSSDQIYKVCWQRVQVVWCEG